MNDDEGVVEISQFMLTRLNALAKNGGASATEKAPPDCLYGGPFHYQPEKWSPKTCFLLVPQLAIAKPRAVGTAITTSMEN